MGLNKAIASAKATMQPHKESYPDDKVGKWLAELGAEKCNLNAWRVMGDNYKLNVQRSRPPVVYKISYKTDDIRLLINMPDKRSPLLTYIKNDLKKYLNKG